MLLVNARIPFRGNYFEKSTSKPCFIGFYHWRIEMLKRSVLVVLFPLLLPASLVLGAPAADLSPINRVTNVRPKPSVFKVSSRKKPLVLRSEKDAAEHFAAGDVAVMAKQVDFKQRFVLVFAWRGSGQDKLDYNVLESFPEQVVFNYKPGRTRDLRPHVYIFALRSNVRWRVGAGKLNGPVAAGSEYIRVEVKGKLNAQVLAIGGETTGVTVSAKGVTWELDLGQNKAWRELASGLHERQVVVTGELTVKRGVEIRQRTIVKVASLKAADTATGKSAYLSGDGRLVHSLVLKDAQGGFAGFSGHIWTVEPGGSWRRQPFLNRNVRDADMKGQLTRDQVVALSRQLAAHDLLGLPKQIGKNIGANPHIFTITFGEKQASLTVPPGAPLPKVDPQSTELDPQARFATIAARLLRATKPRAEEE